MKYQFFHIPAVDPSGGEERLNRFLQRNQVSLPELLTLWTWLVSIHKQMSTAND